MRKKSPDVLEALMSEEMDEGEMPAEEGVDSATEVMPFEEEGEAEEAPAEDTPEGKIAALRKGLDELEMMFGARDFQGNGQGLSED